jgi:hypothetical protein
VWELDELLQARQVVERTMTDQQVRDRYVLVGGVPRHIFASDASFKSAIRIQAEAVNILTTKQVDDIANLHLDSITTFDKSQPKSALIGFRVADDDGGNFTSYSVDPIAPAVVTKVFHQFIKKMWQDLHTVTWGTSIFETYTRHVMVGDPSLFKYRNGVGWRGIGRFKNRFIELGGCEKIGTADDIVAAAKKWPMVVFRPVDPAERLIDFVYRDRNGHFHAFQATIGKTHTANVGEILELERKVGNPRKLSLYYLVPEWRFPTFVTDPVDPRNPPRSKRPGGARPSCSIFHVAIPGPRSARG